MNNGLEEKLTPVYNLVTNALFMIRTSIRYCSDEMDVNMIIKVKKVGGH